MDCCARAKVAEHVTALHRVRWLFFALLVGDIKNALFGEQRLTRTHRDQIQLILARRYSHVGPNASTTIPLEMNIGDIDSALTVGDHLVFLCNNIGTGCLFFLQEILTSNLYVLIGFFNVFYL